MYSRILTQAIDFFFPRDAGDDGCQAVVDNTGKVTGDVKLCGREVFGRGFSDGYKVKYCRAHTPSAAIPAGGRMKSVKFYVSQCDSVVTME